MNTDLLTQLAESTTADLRLRLAHCRVAARDATDALRAEELRVRDELLASVNGDAKQLGSNEELREDRRRSAYTQSPTWLRLKALILTANDEAEFIEAILQGRMDLAQGERLAADERRTDALFALLGKPELLGLAS